jgi:hypothetical protein
LIDPRAVLNIFENGMVFGPLGILTPCLAARSLNIVLCAVSRLQNNWLAFETDINTHAIPTGLHFDR